MTLFLILTLSILLMASIGVISSNNPILSLLYLVITFLIVSFLLIYWEADFLGILFIIVYIGAVIVLFLFIIMMLNIKVLELNYRFIKYTPVGAGILIVCFLEIFYNLKFHLFFQYTNLTEFFSYYQSNDLINFLTLVSEYTNVLAIAQVLYSRYVLLFIIAGVALLVAMLGAIVLTLNQLFRSKRQTIYHQINADVRHTLFLIKTKTT